MLVHSMRARPGATSYAGLLLERGRRAAPTGPRRSAAALLGRLLLALLFVYAGYVQLRRIALRDWALNSAHRCAATVCVTCTIDFVSCVAAHSDVGHGLRSSFLLGRRPWRTRVLEIHIYLCLQCLILVSILCDARLHLLRSYLGFLPERHWRLLAMQLHED